MSPKGEMWVQEAEAGEDAEEFDAAKEEELCQAAAATETTRVTALACPPPSWSATVIVSHDVFVN